MARKSETQNFESSLSQLEEIVEKMEKGDLTLEESLEAFEKGVKLTKECQKALKSAEQKVNKLIPKDEGFSIEPFDPPKENEE